MAPSNPAMTLQKEQRGETPRPNRSLRRPVSPGGNGQTEPRKGPTSIMDPKSYNRTHRAEKKMGGWE